MIDWHIFVDRFLGEKQERKDDGEVELFEKDEVKKRVDGEEVKEEKEEERETGKEDRKREKKREVLKSILPHLIILPGR